MNAAGHYRAAERDARDAYHVPSSEADFYLKRAQVHATLALAGATFLAGSVGYELASGEFAGVVTGADE
jgi:hypothetical protein